LGGGFATRYAPFDETEVMVMKLWSGATGRVTGRASGWLKQSLVVLGALITSGALAGCASAPLREARSELAAGRYADAHQQLLAAREESGLSARRQREIDKDLCLTEFKLGAPSYPLTEQYSACTQATREGASESADLAAKILTEQRTALVATINKAITDGQLGEAEDGIARYRAVTGADPKVIAGWSQRLWLIVKRHDAAAAASHRTLAPMIAEATRHYPKVQAMNDRAFRRWVERNLTVEGAPLMDVARLDNHTLTLRMPEDRLSATALNLDRLVNVNDGMVARCGCAGRTNVAMRTTDLPAYLVRIDPRTRESEVLVLAHP
jgi:hypothetical protein